MCGALCDLRMAPVGASGQQLVGGGSWRPEPKGPPPPPPPRGRVGAENFFAGMRHALKLLNPPMRVYSKCSHRLGDFGSTLWECAWRWGPPRMRGSRSNSALLWAPEKARVRYPLLILLPVLGVGDP